MAEILTRAQLRAFFAVATEGGFSAAARAHGLTQPALTHQVRALEAAYGVTLFLRQGRRVVLSDAGRELLVLVRRMFALEDEADALLAAEGGLRRGTLRVGADGPYHVVPILARLLASHPGLELTVTVGNSAVVEKSLLEVRSDVAVLAQVTDDPRLYARPFSRHPVVVFVARGHRFAKRKRVALEELDGEPMVIREQGSATRAAFDQAAARRGVRPKVVLEIESREAVKEAVAAGIGFGVVSAPEVGFDERLVLIALEGAPIETGEDIVCLEERRHARAIRVFFEAAKALSPRPKR
jgi:aminoethylphosphonate catabolism LysR family transcriptional regulator